MEDRTDAAADLCGDIRLGDRALDELDPVEEGGEPRPVSGREVVHDPNGPATLEEPPHDVMADEPRPARHQDGGVERGHSPPLTMSRAHRIPRYSWTARSTFR